MCVFARFVSLPYLSLTGKVHVDGGAGEKPTGYRITAFSPF